MIRQVTGEALSRWQPDSEAALRLCGQIEAYGDARPFLRFFEDDAGGRLSVCHGDAVLASGEDTEEVRLFLTMNPSIRRVRSDRRTALLLAKDWGMPLRSHCVMCAPYPPEAAESSAMEPKLAHLYPLLVAVFGEAIPPFDEWYADAHFRTRHGLMHTAGVSDGETLLACAMTVSECRQAALIGAVATLPKARGKGYASRCVLTLTGRLQRMGKRVLLSPKNDRAFAIYTHLGFTPCGEWGEVQR